MMAISPPAFPRHRRPNGPGAFSLIEVVLALGIIAFVLTAILGLVTLAVQGSKNADLDAKLAALTTRTISSYQSRPFTNFLATNTAPYTATNYYDYSGTPLSNSGGAYFECAVSNATPAGGALTNLALLQFQIRWPCPQMTSTNVCLFSIFNYQ